MAYAKTERSAAQIVAAATRVLARQGYARTSLLDIAREAGMSKGALHYHFPSKESLVSKVLESALESIANRTLDAWAASSTGPIPALRSSVKELWFVRRARTDEVAVVADLMAQALYDDSLKPQLAGFFRFAAQQVTQLVLPSLRDMGLRLRIPGEMVPRILVGLLDGLAMQHYVDPSAIDEESLLVAVEAMAMGLFEPIPAQERGS